MPRRHRLISPSVAGGSGLLAMFLAIVLTGAISRQHNEVAGVAYAQPPPEPTVRDAAPPSPDAPGGPDEPDDSGVPTEPAGSAAPGSPSRQATSPPAPAPPASGQPPGTVRLTHGGTAILVRREVGPDGVLPVPNSLYKATWWGAGLQATSGATVLAGHVNWKGATGPFAELWQSKIGDPVLVVDQQGQPQTYHVARIVTVDKGELRIRAEELFGQDGPHRLVLVTCGGRWVGGDRGYAANQVVIAFPATS